MAKGKKVLTIGDVARFCNVTARTAQGWFDKRMLDGYLIPGSKFRRVPIGTLIEFMEGNKVPVPDELYELEESLTEK